MLRMIMEHLNSRPDVNGDRYWLAIVTSTKTGNSLRFTTPHYSNTELMMHDAGIEYHELYSTRHEMPIRDWDRMAKTVDMHNTCHDAEVVAAIKALEVN